MTQRRCWWLACLALAVAHAAEKQPAGSTASSDAKHQAAVRSIPQEYRKAVSAALAKAGANRAALVGAISAVAEDQKKAIAFLLANMPDCDLRSLSKDLLVENVRFAFRAQGEAPWGKEIPEELFLNYVLPYANVNERRDNWRGDFFKRFAAVAWQSKTPAEAAQKLNRHVFGALKVKYHARKRRKPHQSPQESIEIGYASCTGLSILLVDACRAVGVPARLAGTPLWTNRSGNHTWTEVWDKQWYYLGSAEPGALNRTHFTAKAAQADPSKWQHRIYAVSYKRTPTHFPLAWDRRIRWVSARDVTRYYRGRKTVTVSVPGAGEGRATVRRDGEIIVVGRGKGKVSLTLAAGQTYDVEVRTADGKTHRSKLSVKEER